MNRNCIIESYYVVSVEPHAKQHTEFIVSKLLLELCGQLHKLHASCNNWSQFDSDLPEWNVISKFYSLFINQN